MATDWMHALSVHYEAACRDYPDRPLMLLCDIDGTIIDMRFMILAVLQAYDQVHGTRFFRRLTVDDIHVHENQVGELLAELRVPLERRPAILAWYMEKRWTPLALQEMHRPFQGVLDVLRWFQIQPNTSVGLVTGRPERLREETLRSLNELGRPHRVHFRSELLYMNPGEWEENVPAVKAAGLRHFQEQGYHVFAFIDNEPENLQAVAQADPDHEILLLHADTIFASKRTRVPPGTMRGREYRLAELIRGEKALPQHVQLVWHGVNDEANLRQFLASDVRWAELDVRTAPLHREPFLRHDSLAETPPTPDEEWLTLRQALTRLKEHKRAVKLDIKGNNALLEEVLEIVAEMGFQDKDLWFNANIERIKEAGFRRIAAVHPGAINQCPIDFLAPLILTVPEKAHEILAMFTEWGVNRFSIAWRESDLWEILDRMDAWGYEVNIYNVLDLESFLQAVLLLPRSVTSDFNFPQWHYYGRGSGQRGRHYEYIMRRKQSR